MRRKNYEIDMCNGPLLGKIIIFSIPMILSGILQLLYNAADVIVVGRFTGSTALAAVGSTGSLTNLIVNLFMGLSVGTSVTVAQYYGAGDWKNVSRAVHTSIATSIISGILVGVFGFCTAKRLLMAMDTPADVLDQAALYMRIYFVGIPASMVYNFGSSILRAVGDTRRPFIFLSVSGLINVVLNLFCDCLSYGSCGSCMGDGYFSGYFGSIDNHKPYSVQRTVQAFPERHKSLP
ncbi:MATE family efflux transporter [Thermoclostridium stercorarium]